MGGPNIHFSSKSPEWETPQWFYDLLDKEFRFTLDPCATHENHKCGKYYTIDEDGLSKPWSPILRGSSKVYMNPPYGREIKYWVRKAYGEAAMPQCSVVVGLVPSRIDTAWWHDWVMKADEIRLVRGRLRFSGHSNGAPFPSAVVVWRGGGWKMPRLSVMDIRRNQ